MPRETQKTEKEKVRKCNFYSINKVLQIPLFCLILQSFSLIGENLTEKHYGKNHGA